MPQRISSNSMWAVLGLGMHVCLCLTVADGLQCLTLPHTLTDLPPGRGHKIRRVFCSILCVCVCVMYREAVCVIGMLCECVVLLQMVPSVSYSSTLSQMTLHWEKHRVGTDAIGVEAASGSQQVISADITLAASYCKVPVRQGKRWVPQHVLCTHTHEYPNMSH